ALDPGPAEVVRDLVRSGRELGEGPLPLGTVGFDDPQSGTVIVLRDLVEPVEGEGEVCEARPFERRTGGVVVAAELAQLFSCCPELIGHCHCCLLTSSPTSQRVTSGTNLRDTEAISTTFGTAQPGAVTNRSSPTRTAAPPRRARAPEAHVPCAARADACMPCPPGAMVRCRGSP